jgi:hypothetical protein
MPACNHTRTAQSTQQEPQQDFDVQYQVLHAASQDRADQKQLTDQMSSLSMALLQ